MSDHHHSESDEEYFDEAQHELIAFERLHNDEEVKTGFSSATVFLDASPSSPLKWDDSLIHAQKLVEGGYRLVFDIDLGLCKPLSHTGQFQASHFALSHFRDTVWPRFQKESGGVILYRARLGDKSPLTQSDDLFFCRDALAEYFELLAPHLPPACPVFLLFDCQEITNPSLLAELTAQDRFSRFHLLLRSAPFAGSWGVWQQGSGCTGYIGRSLPSPKQTETVAVLFPRFQVKACSSLETAMKRLLHKKIPFRVIVEDFLTAEWAGLEDLIVSHTCLSNTTKRAIEGFQAAGGHVIDASLDATLT